MGLYSNVTCYSVTCAMNLHNDTEIMYGYISNTTRKGIHLKSDIYIYILQEM